MNVIFSKELNELQIYKHIERMNMELLGFSFKLIGDKYFINILLYNEERDKIIPIYGCRIEKNGHFIVPEILKSQKKYLLFSVLEEIVYHISKENSLEKLIMKDKALEMKEIKNYFHKTNHFATPFLINTYTTFSIRYHKSIVKKFLEQERGKNITVVDIGCGPGYGSIIISNQENFRVVGVDRNQDAINLAKKININNDNLIFTTELPKDKYDVVISLEALEHNEKPEEFFEIILSVLKDDGLCILSVPNWKYHGVDLNSDHRVNFTLEKLKKFINKFNIEPDIFVSDISETTAENLYSHSCDIKEIDKVNIKEIDKVNRKDINLIYAVFRKRQSILDNGKKSLKKVLFVSHSVPPYEYTGTPISTYNQVKGLIESGYDAAVLIPHPSVTSGFEVEVYEGIKIYKVPSLNWINSFLNDAFIRYEIRWYLDIVDDVLEDYKPDLVHVNDYVFMTSKIIELFEARAIPIVREVHAMEEFCYFTRLKDGCNGPESPLKCAECIMQSKAFPVNKVFYLREFNDFLKSISSRFDYMNYLYNLCDAHIYPSESWRDYFRRYTKIYDKKGYVIPIGVNIKPLNENKEIKKTKIPMNVIYIGTVAYRKGFRLLEELLLDKDVLQNDFEFKIYGQLIDVDISRIKLLEKESKGKVKYMGSYKNSDLPDITKDIDLAVLPYLYESFSIAVRELLLLGIPSLISDTYGVIDIISNWKNGVLFRNGDLQDLKEKFINLINSPDVIDNLKVGALNTKVTSVEEEAKLLIKLYEEIHDNFYKGY